MTKEIKNWINKKQINQTTFDKKILYYVILLDVNLIKYQNEISR